MAPQRNASVVGRGRSRMAKATSRPTPIEHTWEDLAVRWSATVEAMDETAGGHSGRVADYAVALAERVGVAREELRWYRIGGLLHDVGKAAIPTAILTKPGALTPEERRQVERHAEAGADMVASIEWPYDIRTMVLHHHERWDGTGYPHRLARHAIPLSARIMAIADVYDALTSERPYRPAYSPRQAMAIMLADRGAAFDPDLFDAFRELMTPEIYSTVPLRTDGVAGRRVSA